MKRDLQIFEGKYSGGSLVSKTWPILLLALLLATNQSNAQSGIIGQGFTAGWTNPNDIQTMSASAGTSQIITRNPSGTGNQFFRLTRNGGTEMSPSATCTLSDDLDISANVNSTNTINNPTCINGAWYINCPNTTDNYVFKVPTNNSTASFVYFRIQGTVQTVSTVTQSPTVVDYSQPVTVTATLSGAFSTGQAAYLRYTTDGWATSSVVNMTGAAITYTATIPAQATGTTVNYYVFTSGDANVAANGSNADYYTINLNNNGGPNYNYTTSYVSAATGNWSNGGTWVGGAVPPAGVTATIAATHTVTVDVVTANVSVTVNNTGTLSLGNLLYIQAGGSLINNGTLSANANNIQLYNGATLTNNGVFNAGTGTVHFLGTGTLNGSGAITFAYLNIYGAVTVSTIPTITNFLTMAGGSLTQGPYYATNSSLIYNTNAATARGNEWSYNGVGTVGTSQGYPFNVSIAGTGTVLDVYNGAAGVPRACANQLTVNNGNTVNFNAMNAAFTAGALSVSGNFNMGTMTAAVNVTGATIINGTGALSLSTVANGDLNISGNFTNNGTFTHNNRTVTVNGSLGPSLSGTLNGTGATNCFYNLTVNKSASNLSLVTAVTVTNTLTLTNGLLLTAGNALTITNTLNAAISGGSTASYVRGAITWNIASNPGTSYVFPVGVTAYTPFTLNAPTGTLPIITVQAFGAPGPAGTADGTTLTSLSNTEYWLATVAGSFTGSTVSLGRQTALGALNKIGRSANNAALSYMSLGGTAASPNINNSINTGASLGYFVMAQSQPDPTITLVTPGTPSVTGQGSATGYTGQTLTIDGTNFVNTGTGMSVTINGVPATSVTYMSPTQLTAIVANTGLFANGVNLVVTNTNTSGSATLSTFNFLGHVSKAATDWNTNTTWAGNVLPGVGSTVTINDAVTVNGTVVSNPATVTVLATKTLSFGASGILGINTTFTNAGTVDMSAGGTLNMAASTTFANGTATFTGTAGTIAFAGTGIITGTITLPIVTATGGGITFSAGSTIGNRFQINAGGFAATSPIYGNSSTLIYNTAAFTASATEWVANAASGTGVPFNVQVGNGVNTTLTFPNSNQYRQARGNVLISGSSALTLGNTGGGNLQVAGNFTNSGNYTDNGRTAVFNGTGAQAITGNTTFSVITNSNTGGIVSVANGTTITVTGTGTFNTASTNFTVNGGFKNLGNGTTGATLNTLAANFTIGANGTYDHAPSFAAQANLGTIPTATWNAGSTCLISGLTSPNAGAWFNPAASAAQTFSNFTWNTPSLAAASVINMAGATLTASGTFTMTSTGSSTGGFRLGTNSSGTISCGSFSQTGGYINLANGTGNGTIKVTVGNFSQTGGTITQIGSTIGSSIQFNGTTGNQSMTIGGTATYAPTIDNPAIDIVLNNANGMTVTNGTTLLIPRNSTFYRTNGAVTLAGTGVITYSTSYPAYTAVCYNGSGDITTANEEFPTTNGPESLTINMNSSARVVSLHAARTLLSNGTLTLTTGKLSLGSNNLTLLNTAVAAVQPTTPSATSYVVTTSGGGYLIRSIATGSTSGIIYPVGDASSYTPMTLNFATNTVTSHTVGVQAIAGASPNINLPQAATDYVTRYWKTIQSGGAGSYTYNMALTYTAADRQGTEANYQVGSYTTGPSLWRGFATSLATPTITAAVASMSNSTASLAGGEFTARNCTTNYTWTGATDNSWNTITNWSPNGTPTATDNIIINIPGTNTLSVGAAQSINNITLSGTGTFTLTSAGVLNINGSGASAFSNTSTAPTPLNADCASTVNFLSSANTTIPALSFGHLNIAGGTRTLASSGTIKICGNYTGTAAATTTTGSTVDFNGTAAQTISTNATFRNLVISNTGGGTNTAGDLLGKNVIAGIGVTVSNNLTINNGSRLDMGTNTLTLTGSAGNTVNGFLRIGGIAGTITGASAANLTISATGTYEHNYTTVAGVIPGAVWTYPGSTCYIMGYTTFAGSANTSMNQTFSNFTWKCLNVTGNMNIQLDGITPPYIKGNLSVLGTGAGILRFSSNSYTLTVDGDFIVNSAAGNANVALSNGGSGTINLGGNLAVQQPANTVTLQCSSGGSNINFIKSTGTQTITQSGSTTSLPSNLDFTVGNGTTTNTVQLSSSVTLSGTGASAAAVVVNDKATLDFQGYTLTGATGGAAGTFTQNAGATLMTSHVAGFYPTGTNTGSIFSFTTRNYSATGNYTYYGSSAQNTGTALTSAAKLKIDNTGGVTLDASTSVSTSLTLTNGILKLSTFNLTMGAPGQISGQGSTRFIETSGASNSELRIPIPTSGFPVVIDFPVGYGSDYMPVSYNFTANNTATNLRVKAQKPRNTNETSTTDYINNRWWSTDLTITGGTYTYSSSHTYLSGDLIGTSTNIFLSRWNGIGWVSDPNSSVNTGNLTLNSGTGGNSLNQSTGSLATGQWVGMYYHVPTTYTWIAPTDDTWLVAANWSPIGVPTNGDAVIFNHVGARIISNTPNVTLTSMTVIAGTTQLKAPASRVINLSTGTNPIFSVASGSTFVLDGDNTINLKIGAGGTGTVNGNVRVEGDVSNTAAHTIEPNDASGLTFNSGSYFAEGVIGTTNYTGNPFGSTGTANTVVFASGSIYEQFDGANPFGLAQPGSKVTLQSGNLYRYSDNNNAFATAAASGRTYANFEYNSTQNKSVTGASSLSINDLTITQGTFNINMTTAVGHAIRGNISIANGAALTFNPASAGTINLNSGSTQSISGAGSLTIAANSTIAIAAATTVNVQKSITDNGLISVAATGTIDCAANVISGTGAFTLSANATFISGHVPGGVNGNITVAGTKTFTNGSNYTFNGNGNQSTGALMAGTVNILTIANTGTSPNNIVTLSTTNTTATTLNLNGGQFAAGTGQTLRIASPGFVTATSGDFVTGSTAGILSFLGTGTFSGNSNPYDVYIAGGVNFGAGTVTIQNAGSLRINNGGFVNTNGCFYANGSTLVYNNGSVFNAGTEWYANFSTGRGVPYHVQVGLVGVNNTGCSFNTSNAWRQCRGNLTIGQSGGSGYSFVLSTVSGGDLFLAGDWTYNVGTFTHNDRRVTFNGTVNQSIGGLLATTFGYTTIANTGGVGSNTVSELISPVTVTREFALSGGFYNTGVGNTLGMNLNSNFVHTGGDMVNSSAAGNVWLKGSNLLSGTPYLYDVTIGSGVGATPVSFTNNATINHFCTINTQGSVNPNAPKYAVGSTLIYNPGGTYNRSIEWGQVTPLAAGYPHHVIVQNSTTLNLGNTVPPNLECGGNLTIGTSTSGNNVTTMNALAQPLKVLGNVIIGDPAQSGNQLTLSSVSGGDLELSGDFTRYLTTNLFNYGTRAVYFKGSTNSTINATVQKFYKILMQKTGSGDVTLNCAVTIENTADFATGKINTGSLNLLTFENAAVVAGTPGPSSYVNGPCAKQVAVGSTTEFEYPIGKSTAIPVYNPAGIQPVSIAGSTTTFTAEYFAGPHEAIGVMGTNLLGIMRPGYWDISNSNAANSARVKLYYTDPGNGLNNWIYYTGSGISPYYTTATDPYLFTNVAVVHRDAPNTWNFTQTFGNFSSTDPEYRFYTNNGWIYSKAMNTFSPFSIGYAYNVILPIQLLSFTGHVVNADGRLNWKVAESKDLAGFELEYSTDGRSFSKLGAVAANGGTGYSYLHSSLPAGNNFYRLLIKETNGRSFYSGVVLLNQGKLRTQIIGLKQNPVRDQAITLVISANDQPAEAVITDMAGRVYGRSKTKLQSGANQWAVNVRQLAQGMYIINIQTADGEKAGIKFVKE